MHLPAPFSMKHMEFPSRGCLSCLPKSVLQISLARCANCRLAGTAAVWSFGSYGKPHSWGCPGMLESLPACLALSWTMSWQLANGKKQSLPFPMLPPAVLEKRRHSAASYHDRACPCRTLPKTILRIGFIKFDLLRNRMSC